MMERIICSNDQTEKRENADQSRMYKITSGQVTVSTLGKPEGSSALG